MRKNPKTGDPVIPKIAWLCMAMDHADFADSLALLVVAHDIDGPLFDALREMVLRHDALADQYERAAAAVKKGRPKVKPQTTHNAIKAALLGIQYAPKRKPGRPKKPR